MKQLNFMLAVLALATGISSIYLQRDEEAEQEAVREHAADDKNIRWLGDVAVGYSNRDKGVEFKHVSVLKDVQLGVRPDGSAVIRTRPGAWIK